MHPPRHPRAPDAQHLADVHAVLAHGLLCNNASSASSQIPCAARRWALPWTFLTTRCRPPATRRPAPRLPGRFPAQPKCKAPGGQHTYFLAARAGPPALTASPTGSPPAPLPRRTGRTAQDHAPARDEPRRRRAPARAAVRRRLSPARAGRRAARLPVRPARESVRVRGARRGGPHPRVGRHRLRRQRRAERHGLRRDLLDVQGVRGARRGGPPCADPSPRLLAARLAARCGSGRRWQRRGRVGVDRCHPRARRRVRLNAASQPRSTERAAPALGAAVALGDGTSGDPPRDRAVRRGVRRRRELREMPPADRRHRVPVEVADGGCASGSGPDAEMQRRGHRRALRGRR